MSLRPWTRISKRHDTSATFGLRMGRSRKTLPATGVAAGADAENRAKPYKTWQCTAGAKFLPEAITSASLLVANFWMSRPLPARGCIDRPRKYATLRDAAATTVASPH